MAKVRPEVDDLGVVDGSVGEVGGVVGGLDSVSLKVVLLEFSYNASHTLQLMLLKFNKDESIQPVLKKAYSASHRDQKCV